MPNPRAQRPLSLQAVTEDIRSLAQPAQAMLDMLAGAAKGSVSATVGIPGDIESLGRGIASAFRAPSGQRLDAFATGMEQPTVLPTTENVSAKLPAVVPTTAPLSRQHSAGYGQTMGEFIPTPGSGRVVQGGLNAIKSIPAAVQHGAQEFAKASAMGVPHVVKPKGGNWMTGSVEKEFGILKKNKTATQALEEMGRVYPPDVVATMSPETRAQVERAIPHLQKESALNNWIDRNLTNYVKKEMATPEDPVRKLAEQGITHYPVAEDPGYWARHGQSAREDLGGETMAQSPLAKQWENRTDAMIDKTTAQQHQDMMHLAPGMYSDKDEWIKKLAPDTPLYSAEARKFSPLDLGFDHIIDVLREDLTAGRIRPEQLSKVSMEQAVRRTYEYDQELAKKMAEAKTAARKDLPIHKEYPEGYKWVELNKPGSFAQESDMMGHSVRGYEPPEGHPDWTAGSGKRGSPTYGHGGWEAIKSGKAKVYSLVDPQGMSQATIETGRPNYAPRWDNVKQYMDQARDQVMKDRAANGLPLTDQYENEIDRVVEAMAVKMAQENAPHVITQIKGKSNTMPEKDYLRFVQDFVRSSGMPVENDLHHTGLRELPNKKYVNDEELSALAARHYPEHPGMTPADVVMHYERMKGMPDFQNEATKKFIEDLESGNYFPPEGMKRGGQVHISDNPDTMMMELAGGGLTKLARLARAPAKSKEEIRAVAERIAPQMTGEFVRGEKGTQSVAGKTQKQFAREKELKHDIRGDMPAPGTMDYEKLKDQVVIGIAGDPTITGKSVHAVGEHKLDSPSPQHGGPLYGLGHDDSSFWASQLGAAKRVQNLAREVGQQYEQPVLGQYIMMGPDSINYAMHYADANLSAIDPTKMSKKQIEGFNNMIRHGSVNSGPRPGFPGIENKEEAYLQMAIDPELRKHFNALMQMPTVTEKFGLPSGIDVRHAVTEPALRDLETGVTGYSVGKMRPEVEELKLSAHPTYSHDIPGEFMGQSKYPIPYEIMFPDTLKAIRENPKQAPHEFGSLKMVGPRQTIDQQMIDEIRQYEEMMKSLTGKKKGGQIKKAAGGEITADDLTIEERPL